METPKYINELAEKWLAGTITAEEKKTFDEWYNGFDFTELEMYVPESFSEDLFKEQLRLGIKKQIPEFNKVLTKHRTLWPRIAVAAAAIIVFGTCLIYFYTKHDSKVGESVYVNDIKPGTVGATLTLASGKKISLANSRNGELAKESGVSISKTADGKLVYQIQEKNETRSDRINTLSTANGETYQVTLPDGTKVWLNAESSVSYPASFTGTNERIVELKGEAYLEVAKDKTHPFIVKTDRENIQVLGTHFNVYAYPNEPVKTALEEGSVKVSVGLNFKFIKPGQQTVVDENVIQVEDADMEKTLAWKNGYFRFNSEPIKNIMDELSRWYDIEVVFEKKMQEDKFTGKISRFKNISQVLKMLEKTKGVHFKVEGRRVTIQE